MSIASLQARIADDKRNIQLLEERNRLLVNKISKMYDEEAQHCRYSERFKDQLAAEKSNTVSIQSLQNIKIAQACGQDLLNFLSGSKAAAALDGLEKISATFKTRIAEAEEELRQNKERISYLHDDISSCQREIERIRAAARRAASNA